MVSTAVGGGAGVDDDNAIYARLRTGDQEALRVLVTRYHRLLFDFLYRLTDDHALADDFAQQAFIRILTYQGQAPSHVRGWLFTIARNLAYDHFRSARFRYEHLIDFSDQADFVPSEPAATPEQMTIMDDQRQAIAEMLQRLPPEQREVVILRFYHDLSLREIADVVDAPLGTVKSRLFHALRKLKSHLIEIGQTDE